MENLKSEFFIPLMVVLAGLVCVLMLMVREISDLFDFIKSLFDF